ncbi:DNA starvation/stationary phase protection protein [Micromonospora sp. WMMD718]|uniref:Dps family protein n=1 Tax=Micromonospora sediminicola TaxID=946078 RepID=UPI00064BBED5|nr:MULTISPECIES: DNA starvation/stationary phase protection protein [unclassified Micromonospora]MDG4751597.1 DNA starvation/stationary phase protection protein [Micromonospora sp. WMMD718]
MTGIEPVLDTQARQVAGQALQQTLVDLIDLALDGQQARWTIIGPRSPVLRPDLEEVVEVARRHADIVAERAATVGVAPDGRAAAVATGSAVAQWAPGWERDDLVIDHIIDAHATVIAGVRDRLPAVAATDPVTRDVLVAVIADLERQHWRFQACRQ